MSLAAVREIPVWCYADDVRLWAIKPFRAFMPQCQAYSPSELEQISYEDLAKIRAVNPELANQGMADAASYQAAYERIHPAEAKEYQAVTANFANAFVPTGWNPLGDTVGDWITLGIVGVAAFLVIRG